MEQLTDAEEAEVIDPEATRLMDILSEAELGAIAQGDPAATRWLQRALLALQPQEESCP